MVTIAGPKPAEAARLRASLHSIRARLKGGDIKEGKPYFPGRIAAALRVIQDHAGSHGWLDNRVTLDKVRYNPHTNRAAVRFNVILGPKVQIRVTGARVSHKTLADLIPIYEERSFDQDLVEEGERNLISYFQSKGYFDVKVNPEVKKNPSEISLIYQIERGNRHTVARISFAGNRHINGDSLDPKVVIQQAHLFSHGKFSSDLLSQSARNLINLYHDAGFENVRVQPKVKDVEPNLYVTFEITEGPRTMVNALAVTGVKTQTLATLAPGGLALKPGKPFSPAAVGKDRNRIIASYLNLGYLNAAFRASVSPAPHQPHRVDATYVIEEGPQVRVRRVEILGEQQTRPRFIRQNLDIQAGQPLSERKILEAESAFYGLGIFDWAHVGPARPPATSGLDLDGVQAPAPPASPTAAPVRRTADPAERPWDPLADLLVQVHEAQRNTLTYG
ncbi:MAG: POTRA domain-containing protein, partial [Terriglobia bacterium]